MTDRFVHISFMSFLYLFLEENKRRKIFVNDALKYPSTVMTRKKKKLLNQQGEILRCEFLNYEQCLYTREKNVNKQKKKSARKFLKFVNRIGKIKEDSEGTNCEVLRREKKQELILKIVFNRKNLSHFPHSTELLPHRSFDLWHTNRSIHMRFVVNHTLPIHHEIPLQKHKHRPMCRHFLCSNISKWADKHMLQIMLSAAKFSKNNIYRD